MKLAFGDGHIACDNLRLVSLSLASGYESVWGGSDEYVLSTDPGFDPNTLFQTRPNWTRLERAQR